MLQNVLFKNKVVGLLCMANPIIYCLILQNIGVEKGNDYKMKKVIGVIPARYQSSRLLGKPLADIAGKPMLWWVYNCKIVLT